mmetsp:Transcript_16570/g.24772  ORF Transcript_16570/g.24772 Transcript_16570/m.24772 type:complete len:269 (+) Transcript_16570:69-875(+)
MSLSSQSNTNQRQDEQHDALQQTSNSSQTPGTGNRDKTNTVLCVDVNDPTLTDLRMPEAFEKCFPKSAVFPNRQTVREKVNILATKFNFNVSWRSKTSIRCSCSAYSAKYQTLPSTDSDSRAKHSSFITNCQWKINIRGIGKKINGNYKMGENDPVIITTKHLTHNCDPSVPKMLAVQRKSGSITRSLTTSSKYLLCMMLQDNPSTPTKTIRNILMRSSPNKAQHWSCQQIWYVRLNILAMLKDMDQSVLESYEKFESSLRKRRREEM